MASTVRFFSLALLLASVSIVTLASDLDMDALGMNSDYFSNGDDHYGNNDRAIGFSGANDNSRERNVGISNVAIGNSFGPHEHDAFPTFEARIGGGRRKAGIHAPSKTQKRKKVQDKQKKKEKDERTEEERIQDEFIKKREEQERIRRGRYEGKGKNRLTGMF